MITTSLTHAQKYDQIWLQGYSNQLIDTIFGGTIIDFSTDPPELSYHFREMNFQECVASICDKEGNLLFYSNGTWIANANHLEMLNGDNIGPDNYNQSWADDGLPISQSAIILPFPDSNNMYVLINEEVALGGFNGNIAKVPNCYYSIIDMNLDNGLGEVILKNETVINDTLDFGKMVATKHGNGRDWWVIVPQFTSNKYHVLSVNPQGINWEMEQIVGDTSFSGVGQAVFSPDGKKYIRYNACCFNKPAEIDVFDFDRCSGTINHLERIVVDTINGSIDPLGGIAISPNSRFLYLTHFDVIVQYDLHAVDVSATADTVAIYDGFFAPPPSPSNITVTFRLAHLAPDGKIYINTPENTRFLHVINNPDEQGLACNVEQHAIDLPTYNNRTIPNFPNFRLYAEIGSSCDTLRPIAQFMTNPIELDVIFTDESQRTPTEWLWTFGDGNSSILQNPMHLYAQQGSYEVCLIVSNEAGSDTTCQLVEIIVDKVEEIDISERIIISPNPTDGNVLLQLPRNRTEDWQMEWYDSFGRLLLERGIPKGIENENILLHHFPSGVYFYKITNGVRILKIGKVVKE